MLAVIVHWVFLVYTLMLMARLIASWFPSFHKSRFVHFLSFYTDPYLGLFRKIIPSIGMLDLSPVLAFFALQFIEKFILFIL